MPNSDSGPLALVKCAIAGVSALLRKKLAAPAQEAPIPPPSPPVPAPPPPEEETGLRLPAAQSPLYRVYRRSQGLPSPGPEDTFAPSLFVADGEDALPDNILLGWLTSLNARANAWLTAVGAAEVADTADSMPLNSDLSNPDSPQASAPAVPEPAPLDADIALFVTPNRMQAWLFCFPPALGGSLPQLPQLQALLQAQGVVFGIDEQALQAACAEDAALKLMRVATGQPSQDGEDGRVIDRFRRNMEIQLSLREDGTIDYKDLGWLQVLYSGDVICDIIPPTEATSGSDVRGAELRGRNGKNPPLPRGQNTGPNEDDTALISVIDGVLTFFGGVFRVDPLLIIKGSIDNATGNLDVVGDVLIYGDVREGFEVRATGNVTVQGMVEGAVVLADKDIQVGAGVNGNNVGRIRAGGELRCKFIENGTVSATTRVLCDNIVNSTVSSDGDIEVRSGRGAIIGGNITAGRYIDALTVGNRSSRSLTITLGNSAAWLRQYDELEEKIAEITAGIERLQKNIAYMESTGGPLGDMRLSLSVQQMQLAKTQSQLQEMGDRQVKNADCRLRTEVLYPPVHITIGDAQRSLRETSYNAVVYLKEGEVHVANI